MTNEQLGVYLLALSHRVSLAGVLSRERLMSEHKLTLKSATDAIEPMRQVASELHSEGYNLLQTGGSK